MVGALVQGNQTEDEIEKSIDKCLSLHRSTEHGLLDYLLFI